MGNPTMLPEEIIFMGTKPNENKVDVYGIGNPLIDVLAHVSDSEIDDLNLKKGTMELIESERGNIILNRIKDRDKKYSCGGSAPNTMITLAALGVPTALAGMVGKDELGDIYRKRLEEQNVLSDLVTSEGDTGSCIVLVTPDYERTMSTRLGVCQKFAPEHVNHDKIVNAKYFYFTGYMWDTKPQKEAIASAIETARKAGTKVVFDVADPFAVERHHGDFLELISKSVDVLLANREETRLLFGFDDLEKAAKRLAKECGVAAVKNCAEGSCIASERGEFNKINAYPVNAVDSTGAGDNYAAGFLYALLKGYSIADAGKVASYIAAQIVQQTGAQFDEKRAQEIRKAIIEERWRLT